ncbi:MAG: sensor hybrid histidine kinase [Fibrobacteres bacterium]|nr:sensor hybrid histidine kinase [Fibrobacterota bacterium]
MTKTVLFVEDEAQVMRLVVKVLEMRGYSVLQAENSVDAVIVSDSHQGTIDLLLADVELDEIMNGHELAKVLKRSRPKMRVLYTSGYPLDCCIDHGGDRIRMEIQELMAAFMPKPFTPSVLTENVRRAIEELPV